MAAARVTEAAAGVRDWQHLSLTHLFAVFQAQFSLVGHRRHMNTTGAPPQTEARAGRITVGPGWPWPAAFAAFYVAGLNRVGVRLEAGISLRAGGSCREAGRGTQ